VTQIDSGGLVEAWDTRLVSGDKRSRLYADFAGVFGDLLCLSHGDSAVDESGQAVILRAGMRVTAFDADVDADGNRDDIFASGVVVPAPDWLRYKGSRWVLQIDEDGVRHESDLVQG
jgi:hypothetical protein